MRYRQSLTPLLLLLAVGGAIGVIAGTGSGRTLLLSNGDRRLYELHGTWHKMFDWGLAERAPVLVWVLALVVIGIVGLPFVWLACASLPDRGLALARPIGLLLVAWLVWLLASSGLMDFSRRSILVGMGIVATGGVVLVAPRRREFSTWLRERWRLILVEEGVFWALFAAALLVRWANPDLWHPIRGGEKPMDLAYLTAVVKSTHFPPYDPWFAGGQMNYYYFGFVLVAVLVKLTSIVPYVAYNLAVPTLFAFLGSSAFTVVLGLAGNGGRRAGSAGGRSTRRGRGRGQPGARTSGHPRCSAATARRARPRVARTTRPRLLVLVPGHGEGERRVGRAALRCKGAPSHGREDRRTGR